MSGRGSCLIVMAGLGPAIHVFAAGIKERRGWPAFAGHDDGGAVSAPVEAIIPQRILATFRRKIPITTSPGDEPARKHSSRRADARRDGARLSRSARWPAGQR